MSKSQEPQQADSHPQPAMREGGHLLVECLKAQGVDRVFLVPGESYLSVLDGLHGSGIEIVPARHEGGAAMMAEADGKLTGRPGVCLVTRGPGASNAACGVHVAKQDSTPMILLVGQIGRKMTGREAFQEVDYRQTFGDLAKWATQIEHVERIPEVLSHAWHVAMSGRPGPVVVALPEDMLTEPTRVQPGPLVQVASPAPEPEAVIETAQMLREAKAPIMILGGSRWTRADRELAERVAEAWDLPVAVSFRRQMLFSPAHPCFAGDIGLGANPALIERIAKADLVLLVGARFSENPSQSFTLLDIPSPRQKLVHVHPGPEEIGRIYTPSLGINAAPGSFLRALSLEEAPSQQAVRGAAAHSAYRAWSHLPSPRPEGEGACVDLHGVLADLQELAPHAVMTNGAGNYAIWLHRYWQFERWGAQVAPTSGSMGYGLPAAIAAKQRLPEREVICWAGDGCFQMSCQELGTAAQLGLALIVLVIDNGQYGTIRMHQAGRYPGRQSGTNLLNPDFAALARSYGAFAETVTRTSDFRGAFERAQAGAGLALLHLRTDPAILAPTKTLAQLEENAQSSGS
ncbi:MAG: thiamine pyrophosphate-binding protein [Neomegalonema sp.]|nr:thiamine pyrophosphate-binding protein [Neomegalonema sp.]